MKQCHYVFTIFGATGDLTHRKLLPALYFLETEGVLNDNFSIICVARRDKTDESFRKDAVSSIKKNSRIKIKEDLLKKMMDRIHYHKMDFSNKERYRNLK